MSDDNEIKNSPGGNADEPTSLEEDTGSMEEDATKQISGQELQNLRGSVKGGEKPEWLQKVEEEKKRAEGGPEALDDPDSDTKELERDATKTVDRNEIKDLIGDPDDADSGDAGLGASEDSQPTTERESPGIPAEPAPREPSGAVTDETPTADVSDEVEQVRPTDDEDEDDDFGLDDIDIGAAIAEEIGDDEDDPGAVSLDDIDSGYDDEDDDSSTPDISTELEEPDPIATSDPLDGAEEVAADQVDVDEINADASAADSEDELTAEDDDPGFDAVDSSPPPATPDEDIEASDPSDSGLIDLDSLSAAADDDESFAATSVDDEDIDFDAEIGTWERPFAATVLLVAGAIGMIGGGLFHIVPVGLATPLPSLAAAMSIGFGGASCIFMPLPIHNAFKHGVISIFGLIGAGFSAFAWWATGNVDPSALLPIASIAGGFLILIGAIIGIFFSRRKRR